MTVQLEPNKSNIGLSVAVLANDTLFSQSDLQAMSFLLADQGVSVTIVAPHIGPLRSGVNATASYITASSIFFDAIFIGSSQSNSTGALSLDLNAQSFVLEAYSHGKAIGALGNSGQEIMRGLGLTVNAADGLYAGAAAQVTNDVLAALSGPVRFPWRFPTDDVDAICG
jgi:catalase